MNTKNDIKEIKLGELWKLFTQNALYILLAAVIVTVSSFVIYKIVYVPEYTSTATMYILRTQNGDNTSSSQASSDFNLALSVVNDCDFLIKGHTVVDRVIDELKLDIEYKELQKRITTNNPNQTRILEISVTAESPEEAKRIVDSLCVIGAESINDAMNINQVNLFEYGTLNSEPSNKTGLSVFLVLGFLAAILVYAVFLMIYIFDDTIHTEEDIENSLKLTVLGEIPDANFNGTRPNRYMYGKAYGAPYGMPYGYTPNGKNAKNDNGQQKTDSLKK